MFKFASVGNLRWHDWLQQLAMERSWTKFSFMQMCNDVVWNCQCRKLNRTSVSRYEWIQRSSKNTYDLQQFSHCHLRTYRHTFSCMSRGHLGSFLIHSTNPRWAVDMGGWRWFLAHMGLSALHLEDGNSAVTLSVHVYAQLLGASWN